MDEKSSSLANMSISTSDQEGGGVGCEKRGECLEQEIILRVKIRRAQIVEFFRGWIWTSRQDNNRSFLPGWIWTSRQDKSLALSTHNFEILRPNSTAIRRNC